MNPPDARSFAPGAQQALRERVIAAIEPEGLSRAAAARGFGAPRSAVRAWWNSYRRRGAGALRARRRGPKPQPLLRPEQHPRPGHVLTTATPDRVGLGEALGTRAAVADGAARELGARRSRGVGGRWRKAQGFTPRKPARRAYARDRAAVARRLAQE